MKATLTRNIGPIVLFLAIVAAGMVVMAYWVSVVRDDGVPVHPRDRPSISQLGEATTVRPLTTSNRVTPTATTRWPRTRVSDPYRPSTPSKTKTSAHPPADSPPPIPLLGTSEPEVVKSDPPVDVSTTPTPEPTGGVVHIEPEE